MVNRLFRLYRMDICFLQETKLVEVSRDMISRMWGNDNFDFRFTAAVGRSGGLITIWDKASFMLKKDMCSNRLIVVEGLWCSEGFEGVLINVYGPNMLRDQRFFWEEIIEIREQFTNHWIVGGDFNAIRNKSERSNCVGLLRGSRDFGKFIEKCKLVDLPLLGKKFTWFGPENKKSRLDRFLIDEDWFENSEDFQQQGLNRSISNHIPVLLSYGSVDWGPKPFKFFNAWFNKKECLSLIRKEWGEMASKKDKVSGKLRRLKGVLKKWDGEDRYSLERKITEIEERIKSLDAINDDRS
ncbi:uncharacterized protein LOC108451727 [Gossypium arboreum]|uniref:uncharacterized protein LOC108451727 n=1 Tax=Gossypium arboreum TaxID=29729 RepID=UPI000819408A|nr:uncharacterized protein LOC108451727 [Gossypium arboreum]